MRKISAVLASLVIIFGTTATASPAQAVTKYTSCKALNQAYPTGIAKTATAATKASKSFSKPKVSSSIYGANKALDKDKDLVICPIKKSAVDPIAQKWGTFETVTYAGVGDEVIELPTELSTGLATFSHDGDSNFIVWTYDKDFEMVDLVANEIGETSATAAFGLSYFSVTKVKYIEVTANGNWSITLKPLTQAESFNGQGTGSGVFKGTIKSGKKSLTHSGDSNFVIWQWCTNGVTDLVVNEIGTYSGSKLVKAGTCIFTVDADGPWTFN